ncbi:MAG TPA: hypothetical protein VJ720_07215 [Chitinophaga sp.]|nr:hypothetical protein [Chitinophaga sp.]
MAITKLTITASSDMAGKDSLGSIDAMINPAGYSTTYNADYKKSEEMASSDTTQIYMGPGASSLNLDLLVDGTGILPIPEGLTVDKYIKKLTELVFTYHGPYHRPNFLMITWGTVLFNGMCSSLTTNYKLFNSDGTALRAEIKLSLLKSIDFSTKKKKAANQSPDMTHIRTVKAGDTLPAMVYRIYGDPSYYMEVARINGLNSVHDIRPGDQLYFPPLKKI